MPLTAWAGDTHRYTVYLDNTLTSLRVEARFDRPVTSVRAASADASRYLRSATECDRQESLRVSGKRLSVRSGGIRCLSYSVDLAAAADDDRRNSVLSAQNIVVSPRTWLWRPSLANGNSIELTFDVPDTLQVSVPWVETASNVYRLSASPGSGSAISAFGNFTSVSRDVGDTRLRIALLKAQSDYDYDAFADWLEATAQNIMYAYGRFPYPEPQVVVVPVGGSGWNSNSPVPYGRVLRDGGEAVELFVNQHVPIDEFYDDWIATHEFSHLMLPYVTIRQRWVSEGFAQYYQNVLLARAGIYDEQTAWQKIYEGLERGRRSGPGLSPNDSSRGNRRVALMKMYWSGAAIALKADVELRRRSGGVETLDSVLGKLQACCLPSDRVWQAMELFEQLDALIDEPVFLPLYRRYADTPGFPPYDELLDRLGIREARTGVTLSDSATWSDVRRAITGAPTNTTSSHSSPSSFSFPCSPEAAAPCLHRASVPPASVQTSETGQKSPPGPQRPRATATAAPRPAT